jgi:hypothetical protein
MGTPSAIWKHERRQAERIARALLEPPGGIPPWWALVLPSRLAPYLTYRRGLRSTRRNLLFTKKLALEAARKVISGEDRALALGAIERRTRDLLDREKRGVYTEKVRRKQLAEVELLLAHYLRLLRAEGRSLEDGVRACYPDRNAYRAHLQRLHEAEQGVIQASVATVRKGSKQERTRWFRRLSEISDEVRREETDRFFPRGGADPRDEGGGRKHFP